LASSLEDRSSRSLEASQTVISGLSFTGNIDQSPSIYENMEKAVHHDSSKEHVSEDITPFMEVDCETQQIRQESDLESGAQASPVASSNQNQIEDAHDAPNQNSPILGQR
jgi:hypothetical protein